MSLLGFPRALYAVPDVVVSAALGAVADPQRELDSARRIAADALNENAEAHRVLDDIDPDCEPGEPLHERLQRLLAPQLKAVENR